MAVTLASMVLRGARKLDDVPEQYRKEVEEIITKYRETGLLK